MPETGGTTAVRAAALAGATGLLAGVVLLGGTLTGSGELAGQDYRAIFRPFLEYAQRGWHATGSLPLWLPHLFCGLPFLASMNTTVLYPTEVAAWITNAPVAPFLAWDALLHLGLAAAGGAAMMAWGGLRTGPAVLGGLVYAFAGMTATQLAAGALPFCRAAPLLPWLVLGLQAGIAGRGWGVVMAGAVTALCLLTVGPQMLAFAFLFALVLLLVDSAGRPARVAGVLLASAALGGLLAAVWLLPALEYLGRTVRTHPGKSYMSQWAFTPPILLDLVWPGLGGRRLMTPYPGLLPLALAAGGIAVAWRRRLPWLVAGLAAVLWSFGPDWLPGRLIRDLPGLGIMRGWSRWAHLATLALAVLAAEGWQALAEKGRGRRTVVVTLVALVLVTSVAWVGHRTDISLRRAFLAASGSLAVASAAIAVPPAAGLGLACAWTAGDLVLNARPYLPIVPSDRRPAGDAVGDFLGARTGVFRTITDEDPQFVNARIARDLEFASGYHTLPPEDLFRFAAVAARSGRPARMQALLNIRYHVSYSRLESQGLRLLREVQDGSGTRVFIYEDPGALPRLFFPEWGWAAGDWDRAAAIMQDPQWTWRRAPVRGQLLPVRHYARAKVLELGRSTGRLEAVVRAESGALAVASEPAYPGWRALLDGRRVPILRAYGMLMAVEVPAGEHRLVLLWNPVLFSLGLWLSFAALAAVACLIPLPARNRRSRT